VTGRLLLRVSGALEQQCMNRRTKRLDDASAAALDIVRATEMTESEAVRTALQEAAARRRVRSTIQNEVAQLAKDAADRAEMHLIREEMAGLVGL